MLGGLPSLLPQTRFPLLNEILLVLLQIKRHRYRETFLIHRPCDDTRKKVLSQNVAFLFAQFTTICSIDYKNTALWKHAPSNIVDYLGRNSVTYHNHRFAITPQVSHIYL